MLRVLFHRLLVVCLVLNGITAPTALAAHSHAGVETTHASQAAVDRECGAKHHGFAEPATHGEMQASDQEDEAPADQRDDCCGSADCQCGCGMAPVMTLRLSLLAAAPVAMTHFRVIEVNPSPRGFAPPFRPPAG